MININFKAIIISLSIICITLVIGFGLWVMLGSTQQKQKQVKGASISEQDLIQQLEKNVFGDDIKY